MRPATDAELACGQQRASAVAIVMASTGETTTYAELEDRSRARPGAPLAGHRRGRHIAILMENNRPFLEVLWAAQRSGLYFTAINSHLRAAEVQYVLDDCGAAALVASATMADVVATLDLSRIAMRVCVDGELPGSSATTTSWRRGG